MTCAGIEVESCIAAGAWSSPPRSSLTPAIQSPAKSNWF
jgi:hypothetical protein